MRRCSVQRRLHLDARPDGPEGVVLMDLGNAEHRHHGVADELLYRPAVAFDHRAHLGEIAVDDLSGGTPGRAPRPARSSR